MKNYSDSIKLDRWRDLANITEIRKNINEGGSISHSAKAPNGITYGIIRENAHYFIKYTDKQKDLYLLNDYKYLGGLNNIKEGRFDSYSSALKRLNGMFNVLKEEIKYKEAVNELTTTTGDNLEDDDNLFADLEALDNTEVKPEEQPVVSSEPIGDVAPDAETPTGDNAPIETPTDTVEPTTDVPSEGSVEEPSGENPEATTDDNNSEGGDGSADYTEIQSLLGKIQNTITNMETITPQQTKSIINSVISSTKTGLQGLEDKDKEKLSNRILQGGEKIDEEMSIEENKDWIKGAVADHKAGKLHKKLGIPEDQDIPEETIDSEISKLKGKELSPEESTFKKELVLAKTLKHLKKESNPTPMGGLNESIKNVVTEELKRNKAKEIIKNTLIHLKESEKKNLNLKKQQAIFYETFQRLSEGEYDNALDLVKQYIDNPEGTDLNEGVFGDKLKTLAKPFVIAAFMSVLGGEVNAAVQKYKDATGITPTEQEIRAGVNEFKKHSSTDTNQTQTNGVKDELSNLMPTPNATVVKVDEKKLDNNGKKISQTYNVTLPSKLVDARGPKLHNQDVLNKAFDQLDDSKDSERLEKVWDIISYNPDEAIKNGVIKNSKGDVLASNVRLEGENVTYDFVFKNSDSKDFTDGKTPVKMLAGKLVKGQTKPITSNKVWALYKNAGVYNMNPNMMKENPEQYVKTLEKLIKAGYEPIQGTYNWQRSEKGSWIDQNEAVKLFKDGQIRFNDEGLNKEYIQKTNSNQSSDEFKGQTEPVVK